MYRCPIRQVVRFASLGLLALAVVGCGESIGTVSGEVKVKGKDKDEPLPAGVITFASQTRKKGSFTGEIKDGKYTVTGVTAGKAIITIQGTAPPEKVVPPKDKDTKTKDTKAKDTKAKGKGKGEPKPPTANAKYANPKTSGLEYDVTAGEQTHDIVID